MDLSVSIVNWNTRDLLKNCLASLFAQTQGLDYDVWVVDNGSADGSPQMVEKCFPQVRLIKNPDNRGFTKTNNEVMRRSQSQYVLLLNSDTRIVGNALKELTDFMNAHPEAGAAGCRLLNEDESLQHSCGRFPTLASVFFGGIICNRVFKRLFSQRTFFAEYGLSEEDHRTVQDVDFVKGCCLILRRCVLEETGLLDENLFMYFEEIDLCYRIKQRGYKVLYTPRPQVVHLGGKSSLCLDKTARQQWRSLKYFFRKHHGTVDSVLLVGVMVLGALVRLLVYPVLYALRKQRPAAQAAIAWNLSTLKQISLELMNNESARPAKGMMCRPWGPLRLFLKRAANYLVVQLQYRSASPRLRGHPYVLVIDTINICNLRCPLCPTGLDMPGRKKGRMEWDLFRKIIDDLGEYALTVVLHNWGEPLLNKDIFRMISYVRQRRIKTIVSSNLNILNEEGAAALVASGLDELIVSLDGVTAETYGQYRIGGSHPQVVQNIEMLVRIRAAQGSRRPRIIWQYLVFKHNVHEVPEIRGMARRLGVDDVRIVSAQLGGPGQTPYLGDRSTAEAASKWLVQDKRYVGQFDYFSDPRFLSKKRCGYLWKTLSVNWDGTVSPCCCVYDPSTDFGNLKNMDFGQIWNNDLYLSSRKLFSRNRRLFSGPRTICAACRVFRKPEPTSEGPA
jgi:radical SAM protein with 4Fe4S-binding SPASM domain